MKIFEAIKNIGGSIFKCGAEVLSELGRFASPYVKRLIDILLHSNPLKVATLGISVTSAIGLVWIFIKNHFGKNKDKMGSKSAMDITTVGSRRKASKAEKAANEEIKQKMKDSINEEQGLSGKKHGKVDKAVQRCYDQYVKDVEELSVKDLARENEDIGMSAEELARIINGLRRNARFNRLTNFNYT